MMRIVVFCLILLITGCGGSLSDEQRKALKKEMENREIKKVSEEELFEKAYQLGREYVKQLRSTNSGAVAKKNNVRVRFADSNNAELPEKYKGIWEAYIHAPAGTQLEDNVQQNGDTLIYSVPVIEEEQLKGVWLIDIPKKNVVLAL
ncbi:hypothetical protein [Fulvivirga imtechensis]|nr:hypothetical protein [Fulvivirga imtechensis]